MARWRVTEVCATMAHRLPSEIVGAAILVHPRKDRSQRMTKSSITFRTSITFLLCCIPVARAAAAAPAKAQPYPSAPLKLISDSAPGSAPDAILRIVADRQAAGRNQEPPP